AHIGEPFFLYLAFDAPHAPAIPAEQDASLYPTFVHRGRAYREPDISDKPPRIADAATHYDADADDEFHRNQLRSLGAVDRAVSDVIARITMRGLLDDTVFVFTSDNGLLWGEHHLTGKAQPYEEAIRIPLVVVVPGIAPRVDGHLVAMNLDVPAT